MKNFKKSLIGILAVCTSFLFAVNVFASGYIKINKDSCDVVHIYGVNEENSENFEYVFNDFDINKCSFTSLIKPILVNNQSLYTELKSCGGPTYKEWANRTALMEDVYNQQLKLTEEDEMLLHLYNAKVSMIGKILYKYKNILTRIKFRS